MDTRLNVADCRSALQNVIDSSTNPSPLFVPALNEVTEKIINSGRWKGTMVKVTLPATTGFTTLPRWYQSILAMRYRRCPRPIFSTFYEFSESGPGELVDTDAFYGIAADMGDGYPTQTDISTAGTLRITVGLGDAGREIRVFGKDDNGNVIYDAFGAQGINVTTVFPTVTTTQVFSEVTGLQAPSSLNLPWTLSVVNGATVTQIGSYYPGETRPMYKRYRVGDTDEAIHCICYRRFVPLVSETDWVIPGNLTALRYGLQSFVYQQAGQAEEARGAFNDCLDFLNQEAKASRGGGRPTININSEMWGVNIGA